MAYTSTKPSLPGTAELPGESNAKANLASIVAAYSLQCWAHHRDTDLNCWDDLRSSMDAVSGDMLKLLSDYDVAEHDCCMDAVEDCIWRFLRDAPRSSEVRSSWHPVGDEPDDPSEFRIWLGFVGPNCWIHGNFGRTSVCDITVNFNGGYWDSVTRELPLSDDAEAALVWFCDSLVC